MAIVQSAAVPDEDEGRQLASQRTELDRAIDVHHQEASVPPHVPAGRRRHRRAAAARLDGGRADAARADRGGAEDRASRRSTSRTARRWTSGRRRREGTGFEFTEILKPLEPFRDRINVVSGLAHPYVAGAGGADVSAGANHTRAAAVFLTGAVPERGAQAHLGVSADQVAAQHIGQDTPLPSLELSIEESVLACEAAFSCAYRNSISWKSPTAAAADAEQPAAGVREAVRRRRAPTRSGARGGQETRSLLDSVMGQVAVAAEGSAGRRSPPADAVPRRRARDRAAHSAGGSVARARTSRCPTCRAGVPPTFQEHLKLLMDLQVIAFQADITRVSTLMFARELSTRGLSRRRASAIRSTTCRTTRTIAATWIGSRS